MKKRIIVCTIGLLLALKAMAQIPYYAPTVGDGKLYGYSSVKFRPGINHQETYTTFQYGLGDHFATGIDLYTGPDCAYWGGLVRYGRQFSKWFSAGAEVIPSFNLNNSFRFAYLTSALYLNGAISSDGHNADGWSHSFVEDGPGHRYCRRVLLYHQELESLLLGKQFPEIAPAGSHRRRFRALTIRMKVNDSFFVLF